MSLNNTPRSERLHIAFFGKRNSGKSSLINAVTNQEIALVSDVEGTTTDPVYKSMEVQPLGACVFIDTAGFDDVGDLGLLRVEKTREVIEKADIAVFVCTDIDLEKEAAWVTQCKGKGIPCIAVINKIDILQDIQLLQDEITKQLRLEAVKVSAKKKENIGAFLSSLSSLVPEDFAAESITGHLVEDGDCVLLVMPQDIQAPKGRLILPQVQTIRDLLDHRCTVISTTADRMKKSLEKLKEPPKLIITDSQVFGQVYEQKPKESMLTSFSVLFARYKGDIKAFLEGAKAVDRLNEKSRVLIAEACTHKPLSEDIGRVKIPNLLRRKFGENIQIEIVNGADFPKDLSSYDLVVHCGGCMFNRRYVLSRVHSAKEQNVPITNYGVLIAKLTGILDKIDL